MQNMQEVLGWEEDATITTITIGKSSTFLALKQLMLNNLITYHRGAIVAFAAGGLFGGLVGGWVTSRNARTKYDKEKKELVHYVQLQDEIYRQREKQWQQEYQKLYKSFEELEKETVERDYEEFKAPDTDNDDMISRKEFNVYVQKYLSSFPELSEKDFPKFDEFDLDGDGLVSFDEWQNFLFQQKQMEAKKGKDKQGGSNGAYNDLLNALYEQSSQSDGFSSLQKSISNNAKGVRRG